MVGHPDILVHTVVAHHDSRHLADFARDACTFARICVASCGNVETLAPVDVHRSHLLPEGATPDAALLLQTRAIRALGDGLISVVLAAYLTSIDLSETQIGVVIAATMLGSAALTLAVGFAPTTTPGDDCCD